MPNDPYMQINGLGVCIMLYCIGHDTVTLVLLNLACQISVFASEMLCGCASGDPGHWQPIPQSTTLRRIRSPCDTNLHRFFISDTTNSSHVFRVRRSGLKPWRSKLTDGKDRDRRYRESICKRHGDGREEKRMVDVYRSSMRESKSLE
jgi:hypothetical protein